MASYAVMVACDALDQFDPAQPKTFAWVTTTLRRDCIRYLTIEDTQHYHSLVYARQITDHR